MLLSSCSMPLLQSIQDNTNNEAKSDISPSPSDMIMGDEEIDKGTIENNDGENDSSFQIKINNFIIEENDIYEYAWTDQVVYLTQDASTTLITTYSCTETDYYPLCMNKIPFAVTVNGDVVYEGIFALIGTQLTISDPVIYLQISGKQVLLNIRPYHSLFGQFSEEDWSIIKDERIKSIFVENGKIRE